MRLRTKYLGCIYSNVFLFKIIESKIHTVCILFTSWVKQQHNQFVSHFLVSHEQHPHCSDIVSGTEWTDFSYGGSTQACYRNLAGVQGPNGPVSHGARITMWVSAHSERRGFDSIWHYVYFPHLFSIKRLY